MSRVSNCLLALGAIFVCLFLSETSVLAISAPPVQTLPLDTPGLIRTEGDGDLQTSNPTNQYIQITHASVSQKGAVWFNQPISFEKDFEIKMYVYIQNGGSGDGMGVLLKDSSEKNTWIGNRGAGALGIYSPEEYPSSNSDPVQGAIPKSFVVEFDNYYNKPDMDSELSNASNHIAYAYPGLASSYAPYLYGQKYINHLHHQSPQFTKLNDGKWKQFTMDYTKAANQLTYQLEGLPAVTVANFVGGDSSKKETFPSNAAYLGFAGATGPNAAAVQEMAVSFVKVPSVLSLSLREQIAIDDEAPFFDSAALATSADTIPIGTLTKTNSVVKYKSSFTIDDSSALSTIGTGTFSVDNPNGVTIDAKSFKLNGQEVSATYDAQSNKYLVTSSMPLNRGTTYALTYAAAPKLGVDGNLEVTNSANVTVKGSAYGEIDLAANSHNQNLSYQLKAKTSMYVKQKINVLSDGATKNVFDSSKDAFNDPIGISSQKERLEVNDSVGLDEASTIESVSEGVLKIPLNDSLLVDKSSFQLNSTAIPESQITEAEGSLEIKLDKNLQKDASLTLTYVGKPIGFVVDENTSKPIDFSALLVAAVGSAQLTHQASLDFKAKPIIDLKNAGAFSSINDIPLQKVSKRKDLLFDGKDQDENSTELSYFMKDLGDTQPNTDYLPTDELNPIGTHSNRSALNDGTAQAIDTIHYSKDELAKFARGIHYLAIYAVDKEGNYSNVQYQKINIVEDKLTLDRVPNLNFDVSPLFNSNQIAALDDDKATLDYGLSSYEVVNRISGYDGDQSKRGQVLVTDSRVDRSSNWQLYASVTDIRSLKTNKSLSDQAGVVLQLGITGQGTKNILYSNYGAPSVTILSREAGQGEVTAQKKVLVAEQSQASDPQDIQEICLQIEKAQTFLRIKRGSQYDVMDMDQYQVQLTWTLVID